jgi:uncharacterized protein (DUF433 family)
LKKISLPTTKISISFLGGGFWLFTYVENLVIHLQKSIFCKLYPWRITMQDLVNRITFNKNVLCGKPLIRGLRISVEMILELLARGATEEEILQDYPQLEPDDLRAALLYAHHMVARENVFDRVAVG